MNFNYTAKSPDESLALLQTSRNGLSASEVLTRQKKFGPNEITEKGHAIWHILARQFTSPFFYLLFAAGILSLFIGEKIDSAVILVFVALNVGIGFFQEYRAQH